MRRRRGNRNWKQVVKTHLDVPQHHRGVSPQRRDVSILPADDSSEGKGQDQQREGGGAQWRASEPVGRHHTIVDELSRMLVSNEVMPRPMAASRPLLLLPPALLTPLTPPGPAYFTQSNSQ